MPASNGTSRARAIDPMVWVRIGVLVGALALGLILNHFVQRHLAALQELAATDAIAARAQLATEIRIGGLGLFTLTALLGASLIATSRRSARELRFPPTGLWGVGRHSHRHRPSRATPGLRGHGPRRAAACMLADGRGRVLADGNRAAHVPRGPTGAARGAVTYSTIL